jgi:hypothetical protein
MCLGRRRRRICRWIEKGKEGKEGGGIRDMKDGRGNERNEGKHVFIGRF